MPVRHRRRSPQALKLEVLFQSQSPLLALSRWPVLLSLATRKASNTYCQHLISNTSFRRLARYGYHLPPKPLLRSTPCTEHVEFYITRHPWLHLYPTYHQLLVSDSPSTARSPRTSTTTSQYQAGCHHVKSQITSATTLSGPSTVCTAYAAAYAIRQV